MDSSSLEMLEFPKVREILAGFTSFSASRELVLNLQPSSSLALVSLWLQQSAEARHLLSLKPGFSIGNAHDIRGMVQMAAKNKVLEPKALLEIRETLAAARAVRNNIKRQFQELPALWDIAGRIVELPKIEDEIGRCVTSAGEISDSASPRLANLRQGLKDNRQRLYHRLETMLRSKTRQKYIQDDPFITEREGRYVIPVKADFRREIKGIVHDISNTGATVFVEPWETVEMGNELRQFSIEEKQEVDRILSALSAQIGAHEEDICRNVALLAEIDLALAKARYAEKTHSVEAAIKHRDNDQSSPDGKTTVLKLVKARHPLLRGKVVPLDVEIGRDFAILIITGPNTGGKTVALKTVGLLTLMTQAGMPIPAAEESCLPIFDGVFADIGDQQSIEQALSTFSWHIGNIVHIIRDSTQHSLVLLDELGISTDPGEGSALARAILLHFLARGTMTIATTHYSDLKAFAHTTPGLQNASLDFDTATLAPTYHLTMGIPGRSNALSIAAQQGLAQEIIDSAKEMLSQGSQEMDNLLADLVRQRQKLEALNTELETDRKQAEDLKNHLEQESQRLKGQERTIRQEIKDKLLQDAASLQRLIREAESELRKTKKRESVERARKAVAEVHEQTGSQIWQTKTGHDGKTAGEAMAVGDRVRIIDRNLAGTVLAVLENGTELEVQVGNFKLRAGLNEVEKITAPVEDVSRAFPMVKKRQSQTLHSLELDLRGKRADEVDGLLDRYLNDAFLSRLSQVRIIHGYATGTVRQIVRDMLAAHPLVKSFHPGGKDEGGDGVTVVQL